MSELNPEHPVTQAMHDEWHKFAALIMHKQGLSNIEFTAEDLEACANAFNGDGPCVVVHSHKHSFELKLVSMEEGLRLAREHGGMPH